jgi:hypothetical protein
MNRLTETHDRPVILGHCVGAEGDPKHCGKPLASAKFYKQLGVFEHKGKMRCDACQRRDARKAAKLARTAEYIAANVDLSWQEGAACAGVDPALFTSELTCHLIPEPTKAAAVKFCGQCSIRQRCSDEADKHLDSGLRGGVFRVLRPRLAMSNPRRYKRYDLLAGEAPLNALAAARAA